MLLFGYLGLYWGVFALVGRRLGLWSSPLLLPILELIKSRTQIAFPWDLLGYAMTPWWHFTQLAGLGGVYILSAWIVLINLLIYKAGQEIVKGLSWKRCAPYLIGLTLTFLFPIGYSLLQKRLNQPWFQVAIIQPNVSPLDKGDWKSREKIQSDLIRLTKEAAEKRDSNLPLLVIYPETATLVDVTHSTTIGPALQRLSDSLDIEIFTGSPIYDDDHRTWHNGAVLIRPGTDLIKERYYKLRLVPFSEKIPYSDELPLIRKLIGTADMGNWDRGWEYTVFNSRVGKISGLICFEAIFPDLAREFVRRGSRLFVVVTNDGWFGKLPGAYQHAELAVLRSVENGVPMVRSANNGVSFIVDPYGRVLKKTRLFTQEILSGVVPQPLSSTPYRRLGDILLVFYPLGLLVGIVVRLRWLRKNGG